MVAGAANGDSSERYRRLTVASSNMTMYMRMTMRMTTKESDMSDKETKALAGCLMFLLLLIVSPFSWAFSGYALAKLWAWFLVPLGLPTLSLGYAIGLSIIVGYLTWQDIDVDHPKRETWETFTRSLILAAFRPSFALLCGWVVLKAQGR